MGKRLRKILNFFFQLVSPIFFEISVRVGFCDTKRVSDQPPARRVHRGIS
jgi:hypothetical protein